jgi:hypothetical protein
MADGSFSQLFSRVLDALDYRLTQARCGWWTWCAALCRRRLIGRESAIATVLTTILVGASGGSGV